MKKKKMIVTDEEADCFKHLEEEKLGLRRAIGANMTELIDLWKRLAMKYNLDPRHKYVLNLETKEIRSIGDKYE